MTLCIAVRGRSSMIALIDPETQRTRQSAAGVLSHETG